MSFAAEPYGVFVDDLLSNLTGGVTREELVFIEERMPFKLGHGADFMPNTVRCHGIAGGEYRRFHDGVDFEVESDGTVEFLASPEGGPAAHATWPDRGSRFYLAYERKPEGRAPPSINDRNPGSVVRTLAESFAREYAVISRQLEAVYRAGFLTTAEGRDLDQLVKLVGIDRRTRTFASGEVVFSRTTPAVADAFIRAGTLISTADAPAVTVETTEDGVIRAGTLSAAVPVRAQVSGPEGAAPAGSLRVIHRPILGVEEVSNPQALSFGGADETDEALRQRASRALETSGGATVGSLVGALSMIEGIRERDILLEEDHVSFPGTLKLSVAAELDAASAARAVAAIVEHRPAGVRVVHNLPVTPPAVVTPGGGSSGGTSGGSTVTADPMRFPVAITVEVTPASADLTAVQKANLKSAIEDAIEAYVDAHGIGERMIYNRMIRELMAIEGVLDVVAHLHPSSGATGDGFQNLLPDPPSTRPQLGSMEVSILGALIALDVSVKVERLGAAAIADPATALAQIRDDIRTRLDAFLTSVADITPDALKNHLTQTATYKVDDLQYTAEYLDAGLKILSTNPTIELASGEQPWVRAVTVT